MEDYDGYLVPQCKSCPHWMDGSRWDLGCGYIFDCEHIAPVQLTFFEPDPRIKKYCYDGPVIVNDEWSSYYYGFTTAISKAQARNNLTYRWKINHGYAPNSNVILPGKLTVVR